MSERFPFLIDWESEENVFLLNPRFSDDQRDDLLNTARTAASDIKKHVLLLSSGTTASSMLDLKWVALSKEALLAAAASSNQHLGSDHSDVWLHSLPEFHVGGLSIWARSYLSGAKVVRFFKWSSELFIRALVEKSVTLTSLVPAQVYDLVQGRYQCPSSLRAVLVGGGALAPSLYLAARRLGWPLLPTYGMTETGSQIATASLTSLELRDSNSEEIKLPAMEILPHLKVEITEEERIRIQGSSLLTGYVENQEGRGVLVDPKKEGWFYSQDRGERRGNDLKIFGRVGDFIKIGGESVEMGRLRSLFEEIRVQLKIQHDVVLCPVPDDRLGHVIHLFSEESLPSDHLNLLIERYHSQVLAFEKVRKCHRVREIPRTALGKLISTRLMENL